MLLCDRMLAGSDTWATANALAAAIRHLGAVDLVVCGISALDGETGQVGPELACRLGVPQATGCEALELRGDRIVARRIVEGGYEVVSLPLPALVTVAETGFTPRYPTMPGRRRAAHAELLRLGREELGLEPSSVGLEASPTKVAHMAPAPLPDRASRMVDGDFDLDALGIRAAVDRRVAGPRSAAGPRRYGGPGHRTRERAERGRAAGGLGGLRAVRGREDVDLGIGRVAVESLELAPALGGGVGAFCASAELDQVTADAGRYGADVVFGASARELSPFRCLPHARVLAAALRRHEPEVVLFPATTTGRDLAPRVAAMLDTGLAADCTDLTVGPWERRHVRYGPLLHQIRPAMAGGVLATCVTPTARPQMATVRPGVFVTVVRPRSPLRIALPVDLEPGDLAVEVLEREVRDADVGLADADVVVAGGAGCDERSWPMVEDLAEAVGGRVAASRGAVEAGLAPRSLQVGQTGTTVRPHLYIACGVSGALQHLVGMRSARTVVAINRDPDAFMFHVADFGIVGEVADVLPQLAAAFRRTTSA